MFSLRNALIMVLVLIATGLGVWIASAALTGVDVVYTIDEEEPASLTDPVDDDCPVGWPCKVESDLNVADEDQPIPAVTSISPTAFQGAWGTSIPNGTVVGNTDVSWWYYDSEDPCSSLLGTEIVNADKNFLDGGLKGEVSNGYLITDLKRTDRWPVLLENDLRVKYLLDSGHQLVRRSVAVLDSGAMGIGEIPINLLSFDVSDGDGFAGLTYRGTYNVAVTFVPGISLPTTCTPLTSNSLLLGEAAGNALLRCYTPGTHTMTTVLTREVGDPKALVIDATKSDDVVCSPGEGAVGGIAEYPDIAESAGKSSPLSFSALAGAAAAGAVLLVGGAWYARKRRLS